MEKYSVLFKSFTYGEWYTKTSTDSKPAAFSVAHIGNFGRACRVVDNETGEILFETPEDPSFKDVNGNVKKFKF